jgi:predicted metal-dependent phosphoesterase TrpH
MIFDLHCHAVHSDGAPTAAEIVARRMNDYKLAT